MLVSGLCALVALCQDPDADLAAVLASERRRVEVMARVAPAVCSVMGIDSPGGGSGVVIDPLGFVLTNFHVVGKPDIVRMKVGLPDGRLHLATVLGVDPGSDLAVLLLDPRADGAEWPCVALGDSEALLVGEAVFAMGNPFLLATDFQPTTTWGIVSGTHRYQPGQGNRALVYPDCIQVDVPINPGNSGGPLFDMSGDVVGINGRISVRDRGRVNVGVGFAIASNQIANFLADLMSGHFAEHGTLDLNAWFMEAPGGDRHGVFVQALFDDSLATRFGVALGDELTEFNGVEIRSANQLATLVGVLPAGTWVSLGFRGRRADGSFADQRIVEFALSRLDTGSSRDPDRRASDEHRRLAARALARRVGRGDPAPGATLVMTGPEDRRVVIRRHGEKLRIDDDGSALVRTAPGAGFALRDGIVGELTAEEDAKLDRVLATNPWLWRGAPLAQRIAGARLAGGVMVQGLPGFRVELDGDGEQQMLFLLDGRPVGCRYRDPVQRALVELHSIAARTRILIDGTPRPGWSIAEPDFTAPDPALFERPGS